MPQYPALAAQGIYSDDARGIRVFAGQRAETFYIDLGAVFDTLNLRRYLPLLTVVGEDTDFVNPFGVNRFSGANISTIAIEVPIARSTTDRKPASAMPTRATASTSSPAPTAWSAGTSPRTASRRSSRSCPTPYDGKNRRHVDCNETGPGANPCGTPVP
jgi:hypothetical protein